MAFEHHIRVRYGECDQQGVVFNGHWLAFFDDAMTNYVRGLGYDPVTLFADEFDVMLVRSVIEWKAAVTFDDDVAIEVVPTRLGRSSFDLTFTARVGGDEAVAAVITYVSIDPEGHRSRPIPDGIRAKLEADTAG